MGAGYARGTAGVKRGRNPDGLFAAKLEARVSREEDAMNAVAKVSEISSRSDKSFEDAIQVGLARAGKTLRHLTSAWVKEQRIELKEGRIVGYQVNMLVTFVLDE